ncbi:MAG: hypothetical protein AAFY57_03910 [Cyanobacteria bacterium J06642_2]
MMLGLLSHLQKSGKRVSETTLATQMRRIEDYYLGATDIPPDVRRQVAYRKLLVLPTFNAKLAAVAISQWNDVAREKGIPVAQSDRSQGRVIPFRRMQPEQARESAMQAWQSLTSLRLGQMLGESGLLTAEQVDLIVTLQLDDRTQRFGEIAVQQGWLAQETVDFFADRLPKLVKAPWRYPLGQYLRMAALLDDEQTSTILMEQKLKRTRFGEIAAAKGWVKRQTIDWLLEYI